MRRSLLWTFAALTTAIPVFLFHFHGLDWGTPSLAKTNQMFGNAHALARLIPEIQNARETLYAGYEKALAGEAGFEDTRWVSKSSEQPEEWAVFSRTQTLAAARAFLLGVPSDDQQTLSALSRIRPHQGKWDPENYTYGNFYFGVLGLWLGGATATGYLPRSLNTERLLQDPESARRLYVASRAFSAFCTWGLGVLFFLLVWRRAGLLGASLGTLFYLLCPLVLIQSHMAKPHALSPALLTVALFFCLKRLARKEEDSAKWLYGAAALIGAAGACAVTNLFALVMLPLTESQRAQGRLSCVIKPIVLAVLIAAALNPFAFIHVSHFWRVFVFHHLASYGQGSFRLGKACSFLAEFSGFDLALSGALALFLGLFLSPLRQDRELRLVLGTALMMLLLNALVLRHAASATWVILLSGWVLAVLLDRSSGPLRNVIIVLTLGSLLLFLREDWVMRRRLVHSGPTTEAGQWINDHLGKGKTIGLLGPLSPHFPAFAFLDYTLVRLPNPLLSWETRPVPNYLIDVAGSRALRTSPPAPCHLLFDKGPWRAGDFLPRYVATSDNNLVSVYECRS